MAYISQDEKKSLAPAIKAVLKKYGMKGTIGIRHHSTLFVNLQSGAIDFGCNDRQVNEYHIQNNYTGDARDFLLELLAAMRGSNWFDRSDIMTDYFHTKHYTSINIGHWEKPYVCTALAATAN
jgi:hypothetical protein